MLNLNKVFPAVLSASKSAGIATIRISQVNGDVLFEELNAKQETIIGFVLHALVDSARNITAIAVTQMGFGPTPLPLTPAQQSAFGIISDELKEFKTRNPENEGPILEGRIEYELSVRDFKNTLMAVDYGIACGAAIGAGLLNPLSAAGSSAINIFDNGSSSFPRRFFPPWGVGGLVQDPSTGPPPIPPTIIPNDPPSGPISLPGKGSGDPSHDDDP